MEKRLLKHLVDYSYVNNRLDIANVKKVAKLLKDRRENLKEYVKELKKREKDQNVFVYVPTQSLGSYKGKFEKLFPNKKVVWIVYPSLVLGVRIVDGDDVLELSFRKVLQNLISDVKQSYD